MKGFLQLSREVAYALVGFSKAGNSISFGSIVCFRIRRGCFVGAFLLIMVALSVAQGQHVPGSNDASFNTVDAVYGSGEGLNGSVQAIALQPDGKMVVVGNFSAYNNISHSRIARINVDGTLDASFNPGMGLNGGVSSIAVQPDGKIVVVGSFTAYNGVERKHIVRLNTDGSLDDAFNPGAGFDNMVRTIVLQPNGKIVVGGSFNSYNGTGSSRIARLHADGTLDASFSVGTDFSSDVFALALQPDGKIVAGGIFNVYNGTWLNRIARLHTDGTLDTSFNSGTNIDNTVRSIILQTDGKIVAAGDFSFPTGIGQSRILRLHADGTLDPSFNPGTGFNKIVWAIALQSDGKIVAGGDFNSYNGMGRGRIARLNDDGTLDASFNSGTGFNSNVQAIAPQPDGKIVVGGHFSTYNSKEINSITRLKSDGLSDEPFNPGTGFSGDVLSIALQPDGKIVAGGDFISYNGLDYGRIARLHADGTIDASFFSGTGFNSIVHSIALQPDGKIAVGGDFTTFNGTRRGTIIRLNTDGTLDNSFNTGEGFNGLVRSIALQADGKLVVVGDFNYFNKTRRMRIARLHADGTLDDTFNPGEGFNDFVRSVALQPDGKIIVGGFFNFYNGSERNSIARLHPNGLLDSSFRIGTGFNGFVEAISVQADGKIMAGGDFALYNGTPRELIARLNSDGTLDISFNSGLSYDSSIRVLSIVLQKNGKIIIGGDFAQYNSKLRNKIARLNVNGTLDEGFKSGTGFDWYVQAIALQPDGNIVVGGGFLSFDSIPRKRITRLYGDDGAALSTATVLHSQPQILLYPNPTKGDIKIDFLEAAAMVGGAEIKFYNNLGKQVLSKEISVAEVAAGVKLTTTGLASGVYFLTISTRSGMVTKRVVLAE